MKKREEPLNLYKHLEKEMITKGKSMHSSEAIDFARRAAKRISKIEGPVNLPPAPEEKDKEENEK